MIIIIIITHILNDLFIVALHYCSENIKYYKIYYHYNEYIIANTFFSFFFIQQQSTKFTQQL